MAEHVHQAHDGADDAHRRCEATRRLEHRVFALVPLGHRGDIGFHDLAHQLGIGAVDDQQHALPNRLVVDLAGFAFQRQQAFAAGALGQPHEQVDQVALGGLLLMKRYAKHLAQLRDAVQRERDDKRADGAAEHDHGRRQVEQREQDADAACLDDRRAENRDQREAEADARTFIHSSALLAGP